jgi:hypothetical protein
MVVLLHLLNSEPVRKSPRAAFTILRGSLGEHRLSQVSHPAQLIRPCRGRNICIVKPACLTIAVWSTTNLGIDMSKPRLRLIHCSNGVRPRAKHRQHGRSFRPLVVHGGARARSVPRESSWEAALKFFDLGFLACQLNYLAFLQASLTVLEAHNWTAAEKTS